MELYGAATSTQQKKRNAAASTQQTSTQKKKRNAAASKQQKKRKITQLFSTSSVVEVTTTRGIPDFERPWTFSKICTGQDTGFVVRVNERLYILTTSHVVKYNIDVSVNSRKASVIYDMPNCNLALLDVADPGFWIGLLPIKFLPTIPRLGSGLRVIGNASDFGRGLAFNSGNVTSMRLQKYAVEGSELLVIYTSARIYAGCSGCPVIDNNGNCIGVAVFDSTDLLRRTGWIIPYKVVHHFFNDFVRGQEKNGFPVLGFQWQDRDKNSGVVVKPNDLYANDVKAGDIILSIDNKRIDRHGKIDFVYGQKIGLQYVLIDKYIGDLVDVVLLRDGHRLDKQLKLEGSKFLVPSKMPPYFVIDKFLFTDSTLVYLKSTTDYDNLTRNNCPNDSKKKEFRCSTLEARRTRSVFSNSRSVFSNSTLPFLRSTPRYDDLARKNPLNFSKIQEVRVSTLLPTCSTIMIKHAKVSLLNGQNVKSLKSLYKKVNRTSKKYLKFMLEDGITILVLTDDARRKTPGILKDLSIPAECSEDLLSAKRKRKTEEHMAKEQRPKANENGSKCTMNDI